MKIETRFKILYIGNQLSAHGSTPTSIEILGPQLEAEGYELYYASDKRQPIMRMVHMISRIIHYAGQVHVVLIDTYSTNAFYFSWASSLFCRLLRMPYIPILRGGDLPARIAGSPGLSDAVFAHSHTNVVVSEYIKESLDRKGYKSLLIPNNIDIKAYPFKHRISLEPRLLWVRAFHKTYNPSMALHLLKILLVDYPGVTLTMVGPEKDGSSETCKALARELGLVDQVTFTGRLSKNDWISVAADHDIFINTTDFDNLPVSVIEAMALGLPVVSTNVGGVPYLIDHERDGILVPARQPTLMAEAIGKLLKNNAYGATISMAARKKAEMFDWQTIKHQWHSLFNQFSNQEHF